MLISRFILPLLVTILIEGAVAYGMGYRNRDSMIMVALVNTITNPFLNFTAILLAYYGFQNYFYWVILPLELLVIPIEGFLLGYAIPGQRRFYTLSIIMNTASFLLGLWIF